MLIEDRLIEYVDRRDDRLFALIGDLVRLNSENTPPTGNEGDCQQYAASVLRAAGWEPDLYELDGVAPRIDPKAFVHPDAVVIGDVTIGPGSSKRRTLWGGKSFLV